MYSPTIVKEMNTLRNISGEIRTTAITKADSANKKLDEEVWFEVFMSVTVSQRIMKKSVLNHAPVALFVQFGDDKQATYKGEYIKRITKHASN